jgi:membrane glycosyltransferase
MGLLTFVVFVTGAASLLLADLLWGLPLAGWGVVVWLLFTVLMAQIAFGTAQAVFGFLARRGEGDSCLLTKTLTPAEEAGVPLAPTAIVLPIYNEDVRRVYAGLRSIYRSVERTGRLPAFDFYILSDSTNPNRWIEEEAGWVELSRELGARGRIFYRRRRVNSNRKAGNLADFCRRWGRRYRYMIVLDADSVMSGGTIVKLVRLMEHNPGAGLIQTAPALARAETPFARIQQFATRVYGPVFMAGLNYWQQGEGNYWGHNAIIRVAPFMEHCALPELPGREPFGGRILSHDFVEAALLRRAGWAVWSLPDVGGSYEEGPPTLIDSAKRDRRWCQGNLQHFWLLFARGLHGLSRVHLALGILAYGSSLLWLTSLVLGTLLVIGFGRTGLSWLPSPGIAGALGVGAGAQAAALAAFTFFLLFLPKGLAVLDLCLRPAEVKRYGGRLRLLGGAVCETCFSVLQAPVLMLFHAKFVVLTVLGRGVHWVTQSRQASGGVQWREPLHTHAGHTLLGIGWGAALLAFAPGLFPWMAPVLAGMVLSIPFSALSGEAALGRRLRESGWFVTPEETEPPAELRELDEALESQESTHGWAESLEGDEGLMRAVLDPYLNALHRCLLRDRARRSEQIRDYFEVRRELLLREGPQALTAKDKVALLTDAESMDRLHRELWLRPSGEIAPWWRQAMRRYQSPAAVTPATKPGRPALAGPAASLVA